MSWNIPETWQMTTLADVCYRIVDGSHNPPSGQASGKPMLSAKNIQNGKIHFDELRLLSDEDFEVENKRTCISAGDVLLTIVGALGRTAVVPEVHNEFTLQRSVAVLKPETINSNYLRYLLDSPIAQNFFLVNAKGTAQKGIYLKALGAMPAPIAPLAEQTRIAQKLDELLAQVDTLKARLDAIPALLKRFRQSVLAAAISGRLTEEWRSNGVSIDNGHVLHHQIKEAHAAEGGHARGNASDPTEEAHDLSPEDLPKTWDIAELRDICVPGRPITYGILKPGPELDEGIPYIRVADFPGNKLNMANIKKTSSEIDEQFRRARLIAGDLLLSIRGSVGRLIKIPANLEGANITQDTARLSISPLVSTDFVYWALLADSTQRRMKNATRGVAVRGINIGDVRALQIPLPPRVEQNEIVRRVEQLFAFADQLEAKIQTAQARINHLTQSILAKAFRGELVPQAPNDEPASELLARIQAQRAAAPKAKRGRKASA